MKENNIFDTLKATITKQGLRDFLQSRGVEFKGRSGNGFCPFHSHDGKTPSLGISQKGGAAFFNCFACNTAGDAVKFVELSENVAPLKAAKIVADYFGVPFNLNAGEESEQEKKERAAHLALIKEQNEVRRKKALADEKARAANVAKRLENITPILVRDLRENNDPKIEAMVQELFPFSWSENFNEVKNYLGYSHDQQSLAVIIRDKQGAPLNVKYRNKFIHGTSERMDGKWIGEAGASVAPFPFKHFLEHGGEKVIICEGEKDALNLCSLGVNALTLGGVTSSFKDRAELLEALKDKEIYIWFDHDAAGYENAFKRYFELKDVAKNCHIVLFFQLTKKAELKYDISDFIAQNAQKLKDMNLNIFDLITFSAAKPTNLIIDEVCDHFPELKEKLAQYKNGRIVRYFDEILGEFMAQDENGDFINIFAVKGEMDDAAIDAVLNNAKVFVKENKGAYERFKTLYCQSTLLENENLLELEQIQRAFGELFKLQKTMRANYHQTHLIDMMHSFNESLNKMGYPLAQYQGGLYFWTKTHFAKVDITTLTHFIQNKWMSAASVDIKKSSSDNAEKIAQNLTNNAMLLDPLKRDEERRVFNVLNGTLFISKNGKATFKATHSLNDAALNILNFEYDKNADCPKWRKFLAQTIGDNDDINALMEFVGYCFLPSHEYESFLFLYGKSGANGKSVILDTIRSFFGDDNISALQLQQFEGHQLYSLANKMINIGSEIDKNGMDKGQLATLKSLVSTNDRIEINPKNKDSFSLLPSQKPKLAFAGNEKPKQGLDNGVFRRMLLISFDKEIKDGEKIRNLSERFNDEKAGIFNLALAGLNRLIRNGKFTRSAKMAAELEEYKDEVNPIRSFVREMTKQNPRSFVPTRYLYATYRAFVENRGGRAMSDKTFLRSLKDECLAQGFNVEQSQRRVYTSTGLQNNRPPVIVGLEISDETADFEYVAINGENVALRNMSFLNAQNDE